jgi:soluble lytic murein transglycosylase-like protein
VADFDFGKLLQDPAFVYGMNLLGSRGSRNPYADAQNAVMNAQKLQVDQLIAKQQEELRKSQVEENKAQIAMKQQELQMKQNAEKRKQAFLSMPGVAQFFGSQPQEAPTEQPAAPELGGGAAIPQQPMPGSQLQTQALGRYGTPLALIDNLVQTESSGNPQAIGPIIPGTTERAQGLGQFLPSTTAMLKKQGFEFNPLDASPAGQAKQRDAIDFYTQQLLKQHGGDYPKAIAAYGGFKTKDPSAYVAKILKGTGLDKAPASTPQVQQTIAQSTGMSPVDVAKLGIIADEIGLKGQGFYEVAKLMQETNAPAGGYRIGPNGEQRFLKDPYKESEQEFKRGLSKIEGLTPEDRSALIRVNLTKQAEDLTKNYFDKLQGIPEQLVAVRNARESSANAVPFTGSVAEQKLAAVKFLNNNFGWMGISIQPDAVKDAETLRAALFVPIFNSLKLLDAQPSEQQQKLMMLAFGQIGTDPSALPKLINMIEERLETRVKIHNKMYDQAKAAGAPIIYDLKIDLSASKKAPTESGAPMTLDQYLQKHRKK